MAKVTGPLLSLGARGRIAKLVNYQRWRGRPYAKQFVKAFDPETASQVVARTTFFTGDRIWTPAPPLLQAPWNLFAKGQVISGYNSWVGAFIRQNNGQSDLTRTVFSPGARGGLPTLSMTITPSFEALTIDFTNPAVPPGWTLEAAIAAVVRDGDPQTTTAYTITAGEDTIAQAQVVLSGLTPSVQYVVGAWLRWRKPDGSTAYGASRTGLATPGSTPPHIVNAVNFDGVNDWLSKAATIGIANGPEALISFWFNFQGGDSAGAVLFQDNSNRVQVQRSGANKFSILLRTAIVTTIWGFTTDDLYDTVNNPGWHNFLMAARLDGTPVGQLYIDDVVAPITESVAPTTGDMTWLSTNWGCGASAAGSGKYTGDFAEVYVTDEFLDLSVEANRRKFIDASGKPVDLGADGSDPTGTTPLVFFSGATVSWHTNKGSGGGFTENGALATAATSPSD